MHHKVIVDLSSETTAKNSRIDRWRNCLLRNYVASSHGNYTIPTIIGLLIQRIPRIQIYTKVSSAALKEYIPLTHCKILTSMAYSQKITNDALRYLSPENVQKMVFWLLFWIVTLINACLVCLMAPKSCVRCHCFILFIFGKVVTRFKTSIVRCGAWL
jgi:hypothetical protein